MCYILFDTTEEHALKDLEMAPPVLTFMTFCYFGTIKFRFLSIARIAEVEFATPAGA